MEGNYKYKDQVSSSGVMLMSSFIRISPLVQKLLWE